MRFIYVLIAKVYQIKFCWKKKVQLTQIAVTQMDGLEKVLVAPSYWPIRIFCLFGLAKIDTSDFVPDNTHIWICPVRPIQSIGLVFGQSGQWGDQSCFSLVNGGKSLCGQVDTYIRAWLV